MSKQDIGQMELQLQATADSEQQAGIILSILDELMQSKSPRMATYCDKLAALNESLKEEKYEAWVNYYRGRLRYFEMDYAASNVLLEIALGIFSKTNNATGEIDCLNHLAWNDAIGDSYAQGLARARHAIELSDKISYRKGKASASNTMGLIYWHQSNFADSLKNHLVSLDLKIEAGDKLGTASSYNNIALVYSDQGDYSKALEFNLKSLQVKEELNDKHGMAGSNGNIGVIYLKQGNYPLALEFYLKSLRLNEEIANVRGLISVYHNLGTIYRQLGNYILAREYNNKCLTISVAAGDKRQIALSYNSMSNVCMDEGDHKKALDYLMRALELFESIGDKIAICEVYYGIGQIYYQQGDNENAANFAVRSMDLAKSIDSKQGIAQSGYILGMIHTSKGQYEQAEKYLAESLQKAEDMGQKQILCDVLKAFFEMKKAEASWQQALKYYERYIAAKDELLNTDTQNKIMGMQYEFELDKKEREMEIHRLRTVELKHEKDRSDALLLNILPAEVAEELKATGGSEPKHFDHVTVLFTDFQNFTGFSEKLSAKELVNELHACFKAFDELTAKYGIEKIKTVGDGYLAAAGVPVADANHAINILNCAIEIRDFMLHRRQVMGDRTFEVRIGVHSGHVVAGIVGVKKFSYDIWGDTVNTAARMEQNSEAGRINISGATYLLAQNDFKCIYRGKIAAKNKGEIDMYFVESSIPVEKDFSEEPKEMTLG